MGTRRRHALGIFLATAALCAVLVMPGSAAAQTELLPDLQGQEATGLQVSSSGGARELRLSTTIANGGAGPFEIAPVETGDCDGDGNPNNDRIANQNVFEDTNGNGVFDRGPDAFTPNPVGCMVFHPAHGHWHFEEFASYELRAPTGAMVADNSKVSFCVIDFDRFDSSLPGYPNNSFYNNCDEGDTEGISVGWSDTYHRSLPGQEIDITGVPDGDYCVAVAADPSNIVRESDDLNNEALKPIALSGNSVSGSSTGCGGSPPPPPPPPPPPQGGDQAVAQLAAVAQPAAGATPAKCKKKNKKKGSKKKRRKCRRYAR